MNFLIKNAANVNLKNNDGLLSLHVINTITLPEIVELLIIHGTNLHSKSKNNKSVLNEIILRFWGNIILFRFSFEDI